MKKILSILMATLVLATFVVFAVGSSDDSSATVSQGEGTTTGNETENSTLVVNVGDVLTTDSLKITYLEGKEYTGYNEYLGPKDGYKVIALKLEAENISSSDAYLSMFEFSCYADDVAMSEFIYGEELFSTDVISPGRKMSGYIYYEVPKDAEQIEVEYETDYWDNQKAIFVVK